MYLYAMETKTELQSQALGYLDGQIAHHREQIAYHEQMLEQLSRSRQLWLVNPPEAPQRFPANPSLTRDLMRRFLKSYKHPIRTAEIIDALFVGISEQERGKHIKTLSVILHQMEKEGEITVEKVKGVKGNYYSWKTGDIK